MEKGFLNPKYFDRELTDICMDLRGCGKYIYEIKELKPCDPHLLIRVTPEWFVSHTNVRIGSLTFTSGGPATVSVFVCPAGFTPSSWLIMLTSANWDTMNGWILDRLDIEVAGTHESIPTSSKDAYQLGPDDAVYLVNHGQLPLTDVTIALVLPTYKAILSDVKSLSAYQPRPTPSQVSYEWSTKKAAERYTVDKEKIINWLDRAPNASVGRILDMIYDEEND